MLPPLEDLGGARPWCPPGGPNSFIFMQFLAKNCKIIAVLGVGAPASQKYWIRSYVAKFKNILIKIIFFGQNFPFRYNLIFLQMTVLRSAVFSMK